MIRIAMAIMPIPAAHKNIDLAPFRFIFHNMHKLFLWNMMVKREEPVKIDHRSEDLGSLALLFSRMLTNFQMSILSF